MLTFDAETHKYKWEGMIVPGVSEILKTIGLTRDYERVNDYYRQRGIYVHQAIQLHVEHKLDPDSLDEENVRPYFDGYQKFESGEGYRVKHCEMPLYSRQFGFAGTIDQIAQFHGKGYQGDGVVDIKCTENSDKAADLQLCAYAILYHERFNRWPSFRMVLELHGDRTVRPLFYKTDPRLWVDAVMPLYHWKASRRTQDAVA